jgi:hypothetical protein
VHLLNVVIAHNVLTLPNSAALAVVSFGNEFLQTFLMHAACMTLFQKNIHFELRKNIFGKSHWCSVHANKAAMLAVALKMAGNC